jgi:hypothetical protein
VGGLECLDDAADGGRVLPLDPALPPPESTVNGPVFPLDEVRQGSLSIFADCKLPLPAGLRCVSREAAGLGRRGRSLVVVDDEVVEDGDDFEEAVERGEGPVNGGDGVELGMM